MKHADLPLMQSLTAHIGPQIGLLGTMHRPPINNDLANYAIIRHRVGPLLYTAAKRNQMVDEPAAASLSTCFQENLFNKLAQKAVLHRLVKLLQAHNIEFSVLKGTGLSDQIHDNPDLRYTKDIDILIPEEAAVSAIRLLTMSGFVYKSKSLREKSHVTENRQLYEMKLFKDLTFFDPNSLAIIELHIRLFTVEPIELTRDFNSAIKFQTIPSIRNSHYCCYIILHGAISIWFRLKWVVDLSVLARKMPVAERWALMEVAKTYGCQHVISASLRLADEIFAGTLDDEWRAILDELCGGGEDQKLIALFRQSLLSTSKERPDSPERQPKLFDIHATVFRHQVSNIHVVMTRIRVRLWS